jgi:hypothetical protein
VYRNSETCAFSVRTHGIVLSSFTGRNISEMRDISLLINYLFSGHNISEVKHTSLLINAFQVCGGRALQYLKHFYQCYVIGATDHS